MSVDVIMSLGIMFNCNNIFISNNVFKCNTVSYCNNVLCYYNVSAVTITCGNRITHFHKFCRSVVVIMYFIVTMSFAVTILAETTNQVGGWIRYIMFVGLWLQYFSYFVVVYNDRCGF